MDNNTVVVMIMCYTGVRKQQVFWAQGEESLHHNVCCVCVDYVLA